jgi:hypothetical protein
MTPYSRVEFNLATPFLAPTLSFRAPLRLFLLFSYYSTLKKEEAYFSETFIRAYQTVRCHKLGSENMSETKMKTVKNFKLKLLSTFLWDVTH